MQKTVARLLEGKGTDVWSVAPDATVYEALGLLAEKGIGALVVLDGDRLAGIVSERDYARNVVLRNLSSKDVHVSDIMTAGVHTVTLDNTTVECMTLMTDERIRHLPVVEEDRVVGVISIGDVVLSVIDEQKFLIEQLESYITS